MRVLVVGSIGIDTVETPFGKVTDVLGGSAIFASAAASYFAPVTLVGVTGDDIPEDSFAFLEKRGVSLAGLERVKGGRTFRWSGKYHFDMNTRDTLLTELNTLGAFRPVIPEEARSPDVLFLGNLTPDIQASVLDQVKGDPFTVMDTMNYWIDSARDSLDKVLRRVDALVVNDEEARQLAGTPNLVKAAKAIHDMGPDVVVIKKGEHGALLFNDGTIFSAPAYPLEDVIDPTGAGDAFAGGFAGYLARAGTRDDAELKRAVVYGSALASFAVESFSVDRLKELEPEEISQRTRAFQKLVGFEHANAF